MWEDKIKVTKSGYKEGKATVHDTQFMRSNS